MIELPQRAVLRDYQNYIHELEQLHGWLGVDLVKNCFLLGEEVGELFKAVRRHEKLFESADANLAQSVAAGATVDHVGEELVDVFNYLLAIANRLDIDLEAAFRAKNERNQGRVWK